MRNAYEVRGDVTAIFLRRKDGTVLETLIDTVDLPLLDLHPGTWVCQWAPHTKSFYCFATVQDADKGTRRLYLHRYLTGAKKGDIVDHINHDTLDNRRQNLRLTTVSGNAHNSTYSPYGQGRGAHYDRRSGRWQARVKINGRKVTIGTFDTREEAIEAASAWRAANVPCSPESGDPRLLTVYERLRRKRTAKVPGVHFHRRSGKWIARVSVSKVRRYLGQFDSREEAERAVMMFRRKHGLGSPFPTAWRTDPWANNGEQKKQAN